MQQGSHQKQEESTERSSPRYSLEDTPTLTED